MTTPSAVRVGPLAYLTDVEGRWDKVERFVDGNPWVHLDGAGELHVAEGAVFVFGGDAVDRGAGARRIVQTLLSAKRRQPDQVVLIAGNRDLNKLRLLRELSGHPHPATPANVRKGPRGALLRWLFDHTMGARQAFEMRRAELAVEAHDEPAAITDDKVVDSFVEELEPTHGAFADYLMRAQLAYVHGRTLFVHGAVTEEALGYVPGRGHTDTPVRVEDGADVFRWLDGLAEFYDEQMEAYRSQSFDRSGNPGWDELVRYQAPSPGERRNQASVVYGRLVDDVNNPHLPSRAVMRVLRAAGLDRLVVGHTPTGDTPSILRDPHGFELVVADDSYGRVEDGILLTLEGERLSVRARAQLDDGRDAEVCFTTDRRDDDLVHGRRLEGSGHLVKGFSAEGDLLLYRGLPKFRLEQQRVRARSLAGRKLLVPFDPSEQ